MCLHMGQTKVMFDWILRAIGTFLNWIASWSGNYLIVLLILAVLAEVLFLPLGIKQQKNSVKQAKLRPKEMAIRKKYAGRTDKATQQKIALEIQELYKSENYNQFAGCLPLLIQLPIIMAIYNVVMKPLEYVVQLNATTIEELRTLLNIGGAARGGSIELLTAISEKGLDYFAQNGISAASMADLEAHIHNLPDFRVLGINMGLTPSLAWNWLLIVPVLTFVVYFASMKLTRKLTYQPTMTDQQTGCSNNIMDIVMPLFSLFISFSVPAAIGVYWIFKSIVGTLKQFILFKAMPLPVCTEEDIKAAEKELKGKAPLPERDEREFSGEAKKSLCDEDDEEPYPTFVGVKGGRYDDDSSDDKPMPAKEAEAGELGKMSEKLSAAPIKSDAEKANIKAAKAAEKEAKKAEKRRKKYQSKNQ